MCVESDVVAQDCYWYGGHAPRCAELCPDGSVQLAYSFDSRQDAFPHRGDPSRNSPHCSVGIKSFVRARLVYGDNAITYARTGILC